MNKIKYILSFISLVCCTALAVVVVIAWYTNVYNIKDMDFEILQIDSVITMYEADDSNFNGAPDKLDSSDYGKYYNKEITSYVPYAYTYYTEEYDFNYLDQRYALSSDSTSNILNTVSINDAVPSKIYTYKYEIINYVGQENKLVFKFDDYSGLEGDTKKSAITNLSNFECRLGVVNSDSYTFTNWTDFVTNGSYNGLTLKEDITVPSKTGDYSVGRLDIWLQIRMKATTTATFNNFEFPENRIVLTAEVSDSNT